jgi:hypothetical protein
MAVKLVIRDGNPNWWLSPDIWLVPGNDPSGAPGAPIAGQNAYLWAHVANTGSSDANGVRIDFFWANPALQVLRSTATLLGSAYADVPAGGSQDVLCLVPWIPVIVNGGHECVVAVANHSADPLPAPPPDDFAPPAYDQVAQKNLSVLTAAPLMMPMMLTLGAPRREDKTARIKIEIGGTVDREIFRHLSMKELHPAKHPVVAAGIRRESVCGRDHDDIGPAELTLQIPRGTRSAIYLSLRDKGLAQGEYQLVNVIERGERDIVGGYSLVVIRAPSGGPK